MQLTVVGEHMSLHIQMWQDKIILRTAEEIHPSLRKYAKFNHKVHGYLLHFGKQNLQRIHHVYGTLEVKGQERIDDLKKKQQDIVGMKQTLADIKSREERLPIEFKLPPLGAYQHRGIEFLISNKKAPLFASCGTGKTYMILVSTEEHIEKGILERGKTLVCGKLATLETGWLEDTLKFTDLKAQLLWLPSSAYKRREKLIALLEEPADIYIINHEGVMVLEEELAAKKFQKVVLDESTILKSYHGDFTRSGGKFGKALMNVAKHADWRVIMSGTPAPNGPEDLWGQFKFLDPEGLILEPSFHDFRTTYMKELVYGKNPVTSFSKFVFDHTKKGLLKAQLDGLSYQVKIRDHLHELPPRTVIQRKVRMSDEQQAHYEKMLVSLSTVIDDEFVSIDVRLAQIAKLRQITGGFLIDQEEVSHPIKTATKLEALDCLMEEIGNEKVVIYAQYRWEIKTIQERYKDHGLVTVYGDNKSEDNLKNIKGFIQDPAIKIIVLHPKSAAHGVTFTVSHYMIFYSISYSAEDDYQCVARIERAGQKNAMFVYYLISTLEKPIGKISETIDEVIYRVIRQKNKSQEELIDQNAIDTEILNYTGKNK
jgi:SNF2 family DNA or RNA helicase